MPRGSAALSLEPARISARGSRMAKTAACCCAGDAVPDEMPALACNHERAHAHEGLFEARQIDDEPVPHVVPEHPLVRLVDLLDGDDLHVGADLVAGTVVEHLLRLRDAPDGGPGQ